MANENVRALRKRLTPQEVKLWVRLRQLKALGIRVPRQAPIGPYIVDFVLFSPKIIIEVDGGQHGMPVGAKADAIRDEKLRAQGYRVLRYWNVDIDQNLNGVMASIISELPPPDDPLGRHPPHRAQ